MDETSPKKAISLEKLVIQNITNTNELKAKLKDIIASGKDYEFDVSSCLQFLITSTDQEVVLLCVQAIAELTKCDEKRIKFATIDIIRPLLDTLTKPIVPEKLDIVKHSCRSLGNLCCDCDESRAIILENDGVQILSNLLERTLLNDAGAFNEMKLLTCKAILNFCIGGQELCEPVAKSNVPCLIQRILVQELDSNDMDDDLVTTAIMILSVINDNMPEYQFSTELNSAVLKILKETTNVELSEICLDHLQMQAEHESIKTLLAKERAIEFVCTRLGLLLERQQAGELNADDCDVESVVKQACDLIIIVLTGDEAMHLLYDKGFGEVYLTMVKWLDSTNYNLLTAAILAIGNFARQDDYCLQMMENKIFDKLLDIFETYLKFNIQTTNNPTESFIEKTTITKIIHATASAIRNLSVAPANKRTIAAAGRAPPLLLKALAVATEPFVAFKVLAALRMLIDGQEGVARLVSSDVTALQATAGWGRGEHAGAAGEAARLVASCVRHATNSNVVKVEGCIECLVNMLIASHSIMQNEAILALTLLAIEFLKDPGQNEDEQTFISQLIKSEIGKHISVLIETNCAKMPIQVAENLLAFLDITTKKNELSADYKNSKVVESLQKFLDSRNDLNDDQKNCINGVMAAIKGDK